jgi:hypothetical protein
MTGQRKKRIIRVAQVLVTLVAGIVVFGNGCSKGGFSTDNSSSNGTSAVSNAAGQCKSVTDIEVIPGAKTASFVGANQVLQHLSNCVGLAVPSDATMAVYEAKKGSISTYGAANSITPPMMIAITSIAGEVCSDLIDQEITKGSRIFKDINLQAATLPSNASLSTAIGNLALSCWVGNESPEERNIILDMVNQTVAGSEPDAARKAALLICTSMLSSVDALLN